MALILGSHLKIIINHIRAKLQYSRLMVSMRRRRNRIVAIKHGLPGPLLVSLTSYSPRFDRLDVVLKSILFQTVLVDKVILWISFEDSSKIPQKVMDLCSQGLEIMFTDNLRSFKKLVPAVCMFPDYYIITADDDVIYSENWVKEFCDSFNESEKLTIISQRVHKVEKDENGFLPYLKWKRHVTECFTLFSSNDLLPVGISGVLYPPGSLHKDVSRADLFMALCPQADDLWFWWMGQLAGSLVRRTQKEQISEELIQISGHQSLMSVNLTGGNDRQLMNIVMHYR